VPAAPTPALDAHLARFHDVSDAFLTVRAARRDG
jgi:hypothetical protein